MLRKTEGGMHADDCGYSSNTVFGGEGRNGCLWFSSLKPRGVGCVGQMLKMVLKGADVAGRGEVGAHDADDGVDGGDDATHRTF